MINTSTITALLFDMDGLLLDTESLSYRCWSEAATEFGYTLPLTLFVQMIGKPVAENESLVLGALGDDFPYWRVRARRVEIMDRVIEAEGIPVKSGAKTLLQAVQEQGIACGVVTSTALESAEDRLVRGELRSFFDFVLGPEGIERGKPAPDCYLKAAELLKVAPSNCLVLEDSPAGVSAAHEAGMIVCWVPDLVEVDPRLESISHFICADLVEVHQKLIEGGILGQKKAKN